MNLSRQVDSSQPVDWTHPLAHSLEAWWLMLPGLLNGTLLHDLCRRWPGTLTGLAYPPTSTSGPRLSKERQSGWGHVTLNGTSDEIATEYANTLQDFTIALWFKAGPGANSSERLVDKNYGSGFYLGRDEAATPHVWGGGIQEVDPPYGAFLTFPDETQWNHLAMVRQGTTRVLYGNGGALLATDTVSGAAWDTSALLLGGGGGAYCFGSLDDIGLWKRALSNREIAQLYDNSRRGYPELLRRLPQRRYYILHGIPPLVATPSPAVAIATTGVPRVTHTAYARPSPASVIARTLPPGARPGTATLRPALCALQVVVPTSRVAQHATSRPSPAIVTIACTAVRVAQGARAGPTPAPHIARTLAPQAIQTAYVRPSPAQVSTATGMPRCSAGQISARPRPVSILVATGTPRIAQHSRSAPSPAASLWTTNSAYVRQTAPVRPTPVGIVAQVPTPQVIAGGDVVRPTPAIHLALAQTAAACTGPVTACPGPATAVYRTNTVRVAQASRVAPAPANILVTTQAPRSSQIAGARPTPTGILVQPGLPVVAQLATSRPAPASSQWVANIPAMSQAQPGQGAQPLPAAATVTTPTPKITGGVATLRPQPAAVGAATTTPAVATSVYVRPSPAHVGLQVPNAAIRQLVTVEPTPAASVAHPAVPRVAQVISLRPAPAIIRTQSTTGRVVHETVLLPQPLVGVYSTRPPVAHIFIGVVQPHPAVMTVGVPTPGIVYTAPPPQIVRRHPPIALQIQQVAGVTTLGIRQQLVTYGAQIAQRGDAVQAQIQQRHDATTHAVRDEAEPLVLGFA